MNKSFINEKRLKIIIISILFILALIYFVRYLTPDRMIYGSDWLLSGYTNHHYWVDYVKTQHRLPMWDHFNFSGTPTIASRGSGWMIYPLNILYFLFPIHVSYTILYILHIFIAGLGMWFLLKELKLSHFSSSIGAVSFMFAGQLISTTQGGHMGRMIAVMILPYAILFLIRAIKRKTLRDFLIFGGITGTFMIAGHFQISYWLMIGVIIYFIYEMIGRRGMLGRKEIWKLTVYFGLGLLLLGFILSVKLLPPALSLGYGARGITRGYEYTTSWSMPTSEIMNLIAPHFSGILNNYWGENYFKLDSRYLGILPIILIGFAFFYKRDRRTVRFFLFFTLITLLLALGKNTPLFRIYYFLLPMAKKLRAPSMFFFLTTFGICVLSGFGAEAIIDITREKNDKTHKSYLLYLFGFTGLILITTIVINAGDRSVLQFMRNHFLQVWMDSMSRNAIQQKISLMYKNFTYLKQSFWIATLLFVVNGGLIFLIIKKKLDYRLAFPILILILLIDQWSVDKRYLNQTDPPRVYFSKDDVTKFISQDNDLFRVFPLNYERGKGGYLQFHKIENVGGYGPNPPGRYQDFIGAGKSVMFNAPNLFTFPHLLSMINVKYIIAPRLPEDISEYSEKYQEIIKQYRNFYSNFKVAGYGRKYQVLKNDGLMPRASLFYNFDIEESGEEALARILSYEFTLGDLVILEEKVDMELEEGKGKVIINEYHSNEKLFEVSTDKRTFMVVRENYHPHWKCYIDGERTRIYHANYIFYGVFIPEGKHNVKFVYTSKTFNLAAAMSFSGFIIFILSFLLGLKRNSLKTDDK